jgi:NitT/TauT family transport system substrate-binding protein
MFDKINIDEIQKHGRDARVTNWRSVFGDFQQGNRMAQKFMVSFTIFWVGIFLAGCDNSTPSQSGDDTTRPATELSSSQLLLDWKPEPEFGGFYAAKMDGQFARQGLDITLKSAGGGVDMWQLIDTGKAEFGTTAADQVILARAKGADVVAFFAVYQTSPQGIMVHKARGFTSLADVFSHDGSLLMEDNPYRHFLENKYAPVKVAIRSYNFDITEFLAKPDVSQQCFVTSEPIQAKNKGSEAQTFLVADAGYNPYTTVVICKGDLWRSNPSRVKNMAAACRAGWRTYLDDPGAANGKMNAENPDMNLQTFADAATAQKSLIETDQTKANGLGTMTEDRWTTLAQQMVDLKVIDKPVKAADCFANP